MRMSHSLAVWALILQVGDLALRPFFKWGGGAIWTWSFISHECFGLWLLLRFLLIWFILSLPGVRFVNAGKHLVNNPEEAAPNCLEDEELELHPSSLQHWLRAFSGDSMLKLVHPILGCLPLPINCMGSLGKSGERLHNRLHLQDWSHTIGCWDAWPNLEYVNFVVCLY